MNEERFKHYTLGHAKLDQDHWETAQILSKLVQELKAKCYPVARGHLEKLVCQTILHDALEQTLMMEHNYPYMEWHLTQNEKIVKESSDLLKKIDRQEVSHYEIHNFEDALLAHIDWDDRQLVEFLLK